MEQGSVYLVIHFPKNFPIGIDHQIELISSPVKDATFKIYAFPDGHLKIVVQENNIVYSSFESQPIRFLSDNNRIISYIWNGPTASFKINMSPIGSKEISELLIIQDKERPNVQVNQENEFDSVNLKKCVQFRNEMFNPSKTFAKPDRRAKTEQEQVLELYNLSKSLEHNFTEWSSGESYLIITILSLLRSLLCHKKVIKTSDKLIYNPLLFRIASYKSLSLPVYADPVNRQIPQNMLDISENTLSHLVFNVPSLTKTSRTQVLMDFQEWLNGEILIVYKDKEAIFYSINQLLLESSNTIGGGHFDPTIPLNIDYLRNTSSFSIDVINRIAAITSDLSIHFCNLVLSHFKAIEES